MSIAHSTSTDSSVDTRDVPRAASVLLRRLEGWRAELRHGQGATEFGHLDWVNGKRRRVVVTAEVDSVSVRARHPDGRRFFAIWLRRHGHKGWSMDDAWRIRHRDELAPVRLTARQVGAYVDAPDLDTALEASEAAGPKQDGRR